MLHRLSRNLSAGVLARIATAAVSLLFISVLARRWSHGDLGEFTTLLALGYIVQQVPLLGLNAWIVRDLAQAPAQERRRLGAAGIVALVVSGVTGLALVVIGSRIFPAAMRTPLWLLALSAPASALVLVAETALIARHRLAAVARMSVAESLGRTVVWFALVAGGGGTTALIAAYTVGRAATAVAYRLVYGVQIGLRDADRGAVRDLVSPAPVYMGIMACSTVIARLDFVLLATLASLAEVGLYSAPYRIYETLLVVPQVLLIALMPVASELFTGARERFDTLFLEATRIILATGPLVALTLAASAPWLVPLLFGAGFIPAVPVLILLAPVPTLVGLDILMAIALQAGRRPLADLWVLVIGAANYALLLTVLIPRYQAVGAAAATLGAYVVQVVVRYLVARRAVAYPRPMAALLVPVIIACAAGGAVAYLVRPYSDLAALAGSLIAYSAVILAGRVLTREHLAAVRRLARPAAAGERTT